MIAWFIADTHFGKQPGSRKRMTGKTGAELDALIAARWASIVAEEDEVWHLGDIGPNFARLADLPGVKHLIQGNDDPALGKFADAALFASAYKRHLLCVEGHALFLVHRPSDAPPDPGGTVVHGHTHHLDPAPGHCSVSVDRTGWGPISLAELVAMTG